jgi:GNAT superfamily N-acetyltransferase
MIGETFATQGRDQEEYEWLWNTAADLNGLGEPAWSGQGGYTVRELLDYDPPGTFALLTPEGSPCGFYMDSGLWIDPEHRGKGLSSRLILAAAAFHGGSPTNNEGGLGFSDAGYAAHRKAHCLAVQEAVEAGLPVPEGVRDEYGIDPDAEPDMAPGMR